MKTELTLPHHRPILRSVVAALSGMLLATSVATAQESPAPATSEAPAAQPGASPEAGSSSASSELQPRRWSLAQMPARRAGWFLHDVVAGGPGFIAVGGGSQGRARSTPEAIIWVSDSGRAWQAVPLFGEAAEGTIRGITATADGFVAVGDGAAGGAVWRSADGIGWQRVPNDPVFEGSAVFDVADGPAGLVAVGCQGEIDCATSRAWRSTDGGATWESLETAPPGLAQAIAATDAGYLVAGQSAEDGNPMLASSADGQTWQAGAGLPAGPANLAALGSFEDQLAGGSSTESGASRALLLRSADGATWQTIGHRRFREAAFADVVGGSTGVLLLGSRSQRADGELRTRPLALWSADLSRFRATKFPGQSARAGGEINAAAFSADGSLVVAVGATARPVPTVWFNRLAAPRSASDQPIDRDVEVDESTRTPPPETPAESEAPTG